MKNCGNGIQSIWLREQFKKELEDVFRELAEIAGGESNPALLHYRNFRDRLHTGRTPQSSVVFAPLASKNLELASGIAGVERMSVGQLNYDIIHSTCSELLEIPFDLVRKSPTPTIKQALISVEIGNISNPGQVYGVSSSKHAITRKIKTSNALEFLQEDFKNC